MSKPKLGFLGIGIMGEAMVRRLLERGHSVTAWNRDAKKLDRVTAHGAQTAATPAAVTRTSDIVLCCVYDTDAVADCVFGPDGVASAARPGQILVDMTTAEPGRTRQFAERFRRETGAGYVDAPVSGGPDGARHGTMAVMAGGELADIERLRPLMADMSGNFNHMGSAGAGQMTKMINQTIGATNFVVLAEALAIAEACGIDAARLPEVLAGGFADSNLLRKLYPMMQQRAFDPPKSFSRQMLKDLRQLGAFVEELGLDLPAVAMTRAVYEAHVAEGNGGRDPMTIVERLAKKKK